MRLIRDLNLSFADLNRRCVIGCGPTARSRFLVTSYLWKPLGRAVCPSFVALGESHHGRCVALRHHDAVVTGWTTHVNHLVVVVGDRHRRVVT